MKCAFCGIEVNEDQTECWLDRVAHLKCKKIADSFVWDTKYFRQQIIDQVTFDEGKIIPIRWKEMERKRLYAD